MIKKLMPKSKLAKWSLAVLAVLGVAISFVSVLAQPYQPSEDKDPNLQYAKVTVGDHEVFYALAGDINKPGILFIHGTPGGWEAFEGYLESKRLQTDFFMVSVDRPGWGNSIIPKKQINGSFALQSKGIGSVLEQYPNKKWILVGHSLGASIAPQVAIDYPTNVVGLLLLAGSLKPSLGSPRWYNYAASTWVVANLIGDTMKYSNREIMGLRKQLKVMDEKLKTTSLSTDVIIMQGKKDRLVSPKNPAYALQEWRPSFASMKLVELEEEGHFLPWRQASLVAQLMYELAQKQ